jgi:hypothetical protein
VRADAIGASASPLPNATHATAVQAGLRAHEWARRPSRLPVQIHSGSVTQLYSLTVAWAAPVWPLWLHRFPVSLANAFVVRTPERATVSLKKLHLVKLSAAKARKFRGDSCALRVAIAPTALSTIT